MKILVVGNYYYPEHIGGVEIVSYQLVKYYREFGSETRWIAANVPPKYRSAKPGDVPILSWNFSEEKLGFPHPIPFPGELCKLYNNVRWADVVHLQDSLYPINILTFLIAKMLGRPILITQYAKFIPYHQFYKRAIQAAAYRTIGWIMFSMADKVVFITSNVRDNMQHINPQKMKTVIPLGVDTNQYKPLDSLQRLALREKLSGDSSTPIILFVGRLVERKGVHLIRPLIEKHPEWFWVLVGRPDDLNPSEWKLPNLKHLQNLPEKELSRLFACADILVHPTLGEGITLTVYNSLACGTPVLISEESLSELDMEARKLFFPVSRGTKDIEKKLIQAIASQDKLQNLRHRCRDFAIHRLSWEKMGEQYYDILISEIVDR